MSTKPYLVGAPDEIADPPLPTLIHGNKRYFEGDTVDLDDNAAAAHGCRVTPISPPASEPETELPQRAKK